MVTASTSSPTASPRPIHHLSGAARTFKAQALYRTGLTATVEPWEYFWADEPTGVGVHLSGSVR